MIQSNYEIRGKQILQKKLYRGGRFTPTPEDPRPQNPGKNRLNTFMSAFQQPHQAFMNFYVITY